MDDLARDRVAAVNEDTYVDRPFIRALVSAIQKIDPDIGAWIYPETKQVIFFWQRVIIYKVTLNEFNVDQVKIDDHVKAVRSMVRGIKSGLVPIYQIQKDVKNINFNGAKQL